MSVRTMTDTREAVEKYNKLVYGITIAHTSSKSDAEDAFQETFLAYHRSSVKWTDEEHRKAWLIKTAVNMCRRITLNPWRRRIVSLEDTASDTLADDFSFETAEENALMRAVKKLPVKYRSVIWLYYFEDMPVKEISTVTGIGENTVRSQLARGREKLKIALGSEVDYL